MKLTDQQIMCIVVFSLLGPLYGGPWWTFIVLMIMWTTLALVCNWISDQK